MLQREKNGRNGRNEKNKRENKKNAIAIDPDIEFSVIFHYKFVLKRQLLLGKHESPDSRD